MSSLDYTIVAVYLALTLIFGLWSGRNIKNMREYAVGERNFTTTTLGPFALLLLEELQ